MQDDDIKNSSQTDETPEVNAEAEAQEDKSEEPKESEEPKVEETQDIVQKEEETAEVKADENITAAEDTAPAEKSLAEEKQIEERETVPSAKPNDPKGAHWYVVHTYSGHEQKVATTLRQRVESQKLADKILDILVPTQEKIEIKEGKKATIKEKIFPGYLLIRMVLDDNTWLAVRTTPGITSFVGNANKPTPLPEDEVEGIKKFMAMEAPKFKTTFSVGEAVRITDGPFSEFLGSINEMDEEKGKLKVMVSIFGRETPVELDFLQVAKL